MWNCHMKNFSHPILPLLAIFGKCESFMDHRAICGKISSKNTKIPYFLGNKPGALNLAVNYTNFA